MYNQFLSFQHVSQSLSITYSSPFAGQGKVAMPIWMQSVLKSIPVSGTFFYENMVMNIFLRPFPIIMRGFKENNCQKNACLEVVNCIRVVRIPRILDMTSAKSHRFLELHVFIDERFFYELLTFILVYLVHRSIRMRCNETPVETFDLPAIHLLVRKA